MSNTETLIRADNAADFGRLRDLLTSQFKIASGKISSGYLDNSLIVRPAMSGHQKERLRKRGYRANNYSASDTGAFLISID